MPVQITITGENAKEALQEIGGLAAALVGAAPVTDKQKAKAQAATKPEPKKEEPKQPEADEPEAGNADSDEEIPDDVKLRAAASAAASKAGKPAVKALLDQYEVANVTAVPKEQRLAFLKELEALS